MELLVLLIILACYKLLGLRLSRKYDQWFIALANSLSSIFKNQPRVVAFFALLLPVATASLVLWLLESTLFGLVGVILHAAILFYSLGRDNLLQSIEKYLELWRSGDVQSAYRYAEEHFRVQQEFAVDDLASMQQAVRTGILYQWFEQIFVILFWYLVAGPLVALFLRLICLYDNWLRKSETEAQMALALLHAIEWLPVRLLGFTFTIAGNFSACFKCWIEAVLSWHMPTEKVLNNAGMAALGVCSVDNENTELAIEPANLGEVTEEYAREIQLIQDLVVRSLVVWLVVVSIAVIT